MNMDGPALLDLQNVTVMRGQKVVLKNFSLRIRGDEHVAILGPNGCGKSTLIQTITRECYPVAQEGETMRSLARAGIGIILVTHDLSDVIPEIERVLLMSKGRIVAEGPKNQILQPERLEGLFGIKVELAQHGGYYHLW